MSLSFSIDITDSNSKIDLLGMIKCWFIVIPVSLSLMGSCFMCAEKSEYFLQELMSPKAK